MKSEIRFGAKTIVMSLSCDILCDRQKIVIHAHVSVYVQLIYVLHWIYNKDQAV